MRALAFAGLVVLALANGVAAQSALFPAPHTAVCFLDVNGDGLRSADDPVYLQQTCAGGAAAGDARLFASGGFPGGTLIGGLDADAGTPTAPMGAAYASYDADGSGAYGPGDPLFLAFGPLPGPLRPGDLPLTGEHPFTSVPPADPRVGWPLSRAAVPIGGESYQERDGNPGFTTQDALFLDLDASGQVSIGDLRLAVAAQPAPPSTSPDPDPSPTMTETSTTSTDLSTEALPIPDETSRQPPASAPPRETPGLGLAGLAGLLLWTLRRSSH